MVPDRPQIYHIAPISKLPAIIADGQLISDALVHERSLESQVVGISKIKNARLQRRVDCHKGIMVGDCVPFYFCPRSVMLYVIYRRDHPELTYRDGQETMVHLVADLYEAVAWAKTNGVRWSFTDRNARAAYASFHNDLTELDQINWEHVKATDWRDSVVKEGKQAEFLMHQAFAWRLIRSIGVANSGIKSQVEAICASQNPGPVVKVMNNWYY
jgi:hypothetical protein